jgi:hypothetical protein
MELLSFGSGIRFPVETTSMRVELDSDAVLAALVANHAAMELKYQVMIAKLERELKTGEKNSAAQNASHDTQMQSERDHGVAALTKLTGEYQNRHQTLKDVQEARVAALMEKIKLEKESHLRHAKQATDNLTALVKKFKVDQDDQQSKHEVELQRLRDQNQIQEERQDKAHTIALSALEENLMTRVHQSEREHQQMKDYFKLYKAKAVQIIRSLQEKSINELAALRRKHVSDMERASEKHSLELEQARATTASKEEPNPEKAIYTKYANSPKSDPSQSSTDSSLSPSNGGTAIRNYSPCQLQYTHDFNLLPSQSVEQDILGETFIA